MSERRAARGRTTAGRLRYYGNELPPELAIGPCVEDWAQPGDSWPALAARHRWGDAVDEWAEATGWATSSRPACNARNLARTRHPWSRGYLEETGRGDLVDYFEGRRADWPEGANIVGWAAR